MIPQLSLPHDREPNAEEQVEADRIIAEAKELIRNARRILTREPATIGGPRVYRSVGRSGTLPVFHQE